MIEKKEKFVVNRLFIVGNGFDISLGLSTRYKDFLLWFFKKHIKIKNDLKKDCDYFKVNFKDPRNTYQDIDNIILDKIHNLEDLKNHYSFTLNFNSKALINTLLLNNQDENWADIEMLYYKLLCNLLCDKKPKYTIEELNAELDFLKNELKEYLKTQIHFQNDFMKDIEYKEQFKSPINNSEFVDLGENVELEIGVNYFLNFNYTNHLNKVLTSSNFHSLENIRINNIHGTLYRDIIFGYGDEKDENFYKLEGINNSKYLHNIKSYYYQKDGEYRDLMKFLDSKIFQVCIYGHSCSISDRVILSPILEHNNCNSIRIFYYDNDDFHNKNIEILKHSKNRELLRKKIVPQKEFDKMFQYY